MTFRTATALAAAALSTAALVAPAATAQAETATPFGTPTLKSLGITSPVQDMVLADGRVWVSTGNEVDVFTTTGTKLAGLTGLLGADGLLASADGSKVYVAVSQNAQIVTLDTTTMTQTASWPTGTCPAHLSLAAGRLFYSYGCQTWQGAIGSVSVTDGSAGPAIADGLYSDAWLAGAGDTLVASAQGSSPAALTSYTANPDGTVTTLATASVEFNNDFAVSPDGSQLIMTGNGAVVRYNTADLSPAGSFSINDTWSDAVAYSPDGTRLAGSLGSSYLDMVRVYDAGSGTLTSHSTEYHNNTYSNPAILAGTLQFSADGTLIYGIAPSPQGTAELVTATTQSVSTSSLSATVTNPARYGQAATVRVSAPGRPHTRVYVAVPGLGNNKKTYSAMTDGSGQAVIYATPSFSGVATISVPGDLRHDATSITRSITAHAKIVVALSGYTSISGGVRHYRSVSAVHISTTVLPSRRALVHVVLQAKLGKTWTTRATTSFDTAYTGAGYVYLTSANKHLDYRVIVSFSGDSANSKAVTVISPMFIIG